jgi:hypothetical protein
VFAPEHLAEVVVGDGASFGEQECGEHGALFASVDGVLVSVGVDADGSQDPEFRHETCFPFPHFYFSR